MAREAKPPIVPPRPDMLRSKPRSPGPQTVPPDAARPKSRPPNSPPSVYPQASPNLGTELKPDSTEKPTDTKKARREAAIRPTSSKSSPEKEPAVKFTSSTAGGSRSPSLDPALLVVGKTRSNATSKHTDKQDLPQMSGSEKDLRSTETSTPKPVASHRSTSTKGKEKDRMIVRDEKDAKSISSQRTSPSRKEQGVPTASREIVRSTRSQSSRPRGSSVADTQSLIRSTHSIRSGTSTVQRFQQRQDVYLTHTRSAEARALYAEAKDHYGKAKNHLQEALKLSADVFRLAPHVLVENVATREMRSKTPSVPVQATLPLVTPTATASLVSANKGARYVPEYPGLGIQYRSLFAPLLANVSNTEKDRKQALAKKREDDAAGQQRALVVSHTGGKSSVAGSSRSGRSSGISRNAPAKIPPVPPVPPVPPIPETVPMSTSVKSPSVKSRATSQGSRQRTKRRPALSIASGSTRTAARMRDNYEHRPRTRTRSAASRRLRKKKEEEVDHGILWFFSY